MKATDCPWRFPDGEVAGVLTSVCASTQMRPRSGHWREWPSTEPIARLRERERETRVRVRHEHVGLS